jgi:cyanophycin synthetase
LVEWDGTDEHEILDVADLPVGIGGLARHNVSNALAAAGGARAMGATIEQIADGLHHFSPSAALPPGRMNLFRLGPRTVIVDFAHNEAGTEAILDVAEALAGGAAGGTAPITAIIGTAGDRPDETLRGIGRIAAERVQRVAIKETLSYLRGRERGEIIRMIRAGITDGEGDGDSVPVYETEPMALESELVGPGAAIADGSRPDAPRVLVLLCHEARDEVFALLARLGARPMDIVAEVQRQGGLRELAPRLGERRLG